MGGRIVAALKRMIRRVDITQLNYVLLIDEDTSTIYKRSKHNITLRYC